MPLKEWYKEWFNSPYYDILYYKRNEQEAAAFIQLLINHLAPERESLMLDVACGKGRHSRVLSEMGFDVTGIDLSEAAIADAKKSETENLHFFCHDMRLPFYINYFDCAFNFFTSFGYFHTEREHNNAIRTIAQSVKNNGLFVIDYLNVHYAEDNLVKTEHIVIDEIPFHISRWNDDDHFFKQIQVEKPGRHALTHLYTEKVAKFSLGDFTDMLAYQNMQIQEVFGDYQLGPYNVRKSPRMVIVAKKVVH
jgi:SAM-dependent methyltransferase